MIHKIIDTEDSLFHYTNVESLALILKNRTIRFNSLDKLDDLQEKETADIESIGQFCYVSSWTNDITESIPMWNMYSSLDRGVRIKLKKNPFKLHDNLASDLSKLFHKPVEDKTNGVPFQTIIPLAEMISKNFFTPQTTSEEMLTKVEYTDEKSKLYPGLVCANTNQVTIALGKLGKFKNSYWNFQMEWRYIFYALPFNGFKSISNGTFGVTDEDLQTYVDKMLSGLEKQPFPYYDFIISDDAFTNMEITLSPRISAGNRTIVESLINVHNHSASIHSSCLMGLI